MQTDFSGKVALVTGSAKRVGKAIALELAASGADIMVTYHSSDDETVKQTLNEIQAHGVEAHAVQADVSKPEEIENIFAAIEEHFGRLDLLVNSAALFERGDLLDMSLEDWNRSIAVNLTAPFLCTQHGGKMMLQNDPSGGAIVNICDMGAIRPYKKMPAHNVSKAGLWMLTMSSALDLGPHIRVNTVVPGAVMKPPDYSDEVWEKAAQKSPLKTTGSGEDVARTVAFLLSQPYITGETIYIDGGEHLVMP